MRIFTFVPFIVLLASCQPAHEHGQVETAEQKRPLSKGDEIINEAINAHGGEKYDEAHYSFEFRDKTYVFHNQGTKFDYEVTATKEGIITKDHLNNDGFHRTIDGKEAKLSKKDVKKYRIALNSVIYFATLPHKLSDPAVNKSL